MRNNNSYEQINEISKLLHNDSKIDTYLKNFEGRENPRSVELQCPNKTDKYFKTVK